jgi:hypothetical protein
LLWLYFGVKILQTICPGWTWTKILLITASQVARITGVSHWHPAKRTLKCRVASAFDTDGHDSADWKVDVVRERRERLEWCPWRQGGLLHVSAGLGAKRCIHGHRGQQRLGERCTGWVAVWQKPLETLSDVSSSPCETGSKVPS